MKSGRVGASAHIYPVNSIHLPGRTKKVCKLGRMLLATLHATPVKLSGYLVACIAPESPRNLNFTKSKSGWVEVLSHLPGQKYFLKFVPIRLGLSYANTQGLAAHHTPYKDK